MTRLAFPIRTDGISYIATHHIIVCPTHLPPTNFLRLEIQIFFRGNIEKVMGTLEIYQYL